MVGVGVGGGGGGGGGWLQLRCVGATLLGCGLLDVDAAGEAFIAAAVH